MPVIDSHQHIWDLDHVSYPWLTGEAGILNRTYSFDELEPELDACGITGTVLVQSADSVEETRWMQRTAERHARVLAIVGWVPLEHPDQAAELLDEYSRDPRIVGVRHLIHNESDEDWLLRPRVRVGLDLLSDRGLTLDVVAVTPRHLQLLPILSERHPELRIVIDHLGKPAIAANGWEPWASGLRAAAANPHVHAKVSGLNTAANIDSWVIGDLAPYVGYALETFGADRLMYGGDWPVTLLAGGYRKVWEATTSLLAVLTSEEREAVLWKTAAAFYGVDLGEAVHALPCPNPRPDRSQTKSAH